MNTVAISLGIKTWTPYPGNIRKKLAPEMMEKVTKPKGTASGKGNYDEGKRNREAILNCLSDGKVYKLADIAHEANLSETTARRHLLDLVSKNIAMTNIGTVVISRKNPLLFWIAKKGGVGMTLAEEKKIRKAFSELKKADKNQRFDFNTAANYILFKAGYLALLNELEYVGENKVDKLYRLPGLGD